MECIMRPQCYQYHIVSKWPLPSPSPSPPFKDDELVEPVAEFVEVCLLVAFNSLPHPRGFLSLSDHELFKI